MEWQQRRLGRRLPPLGSVLSARDLFLQLVQLNKELQKKDDRIAELEARLLSLTNQIAVSMAPRNVDRCTCPHCPCGTGSNGGQRSPVGSTPTLMTQPVAGGVGRTLSPIEENWSERREEEKEEGQEEQERGKQWEKSGGSTHSKTVEDGGHIFSAEEGRDGVCGGSVGESRKDQSFSRHDKRATPPRGMERMELEQQKVQCYSISYCLLSIVHCC